jgi:D-arginine dehydrogenase
VTPAADVVIVGGGIAGASLAYFLGTHGGARVVLLEREAQPGRHATGRSAAVLAEIDAVPTLLELKVAGGRFLRAPPADFSETPLLDPSGLLVLLRGEHWAFLRAAVGDLRALGVTATLLTTAEAVGLVPVLRPDHFEGAALLPDDGRLDVHALLTSYLRHARASGAVTRLAATVTAVLRDGPRCVGVRTAAGDVVRGRWIVNAAGAWAAEIGHLAGAMPIPLVPHRRTIAVFDPPGDHTVRHWPFVSCDQDGVYFAPESGGVLVSPMDEDPMPPHDARPDERRIAEAFDRLGRVAPPLVPRHVRRAWAGLRTFAPDRVPVVGEDPTRPGFFWLAGQGGCGIETSPVLGRVAADLIATGRTTAFDATRLAPARCAPER